MRKKKRTKSDKKLIASIHINGNDITKVEVKTLPNGKNHYIVDVKLAHYQLGYNNQNEKLKHAFRSPNFSITSWVDELKFAGHFCFVDTNRIISPFPDRPDLVHATAWYIFRLVELNINKGEMDTEITWKTDCINSNIGFCLNPDGEGCPEKRGWQLAIETMKEMGVDKAKIFVDKHQNELEELSKKLPNGWQYFYVSSDRSGTWFNLIFKRLDSAIKILAQHAPKEYEKVDIEKYLMGNVEHLHKKDGTH
jgi:hypothetical protein